MKKLAALAAAGVLMMSCFAACGSDDDDSSSGGCVGKWACTEIKAGNQTITNLLGMSTESMLQVEFKDDGTYYAGSSGKLSKQGTWESIDDDTVKVVADESASVINGTKEIDFSSDSFTVEGSASGYTGAITFKRVDEFPSMNVSDQLSDLADAFKSYAG